MDRLDASTCTMNEDEAEEIDGPNDYGKIIQQINVTIIIQ